ncbi:hypothetical protein KAFR_0L01970 [Kazachstania africana CBS 2517]|uniref:RNB domain-containing protein n=1 Tax=Kazachstania africana (strain ATCC 22294 / BCRC 22015 / CBS 2517 / CECT 1963 / NBRC 1671 / NRRL Y-8276) TaxID=1071382 RepID=H2B2F8_KAZAF|nr:hypothetical protein KAFR_0L01970 [Kazachstania africana CBS 2517]CCF60808.1 hypothetical protein KAFR_0L01970 [Kazachstania africana CBS 2517]
MNVLCATRRLHSSRLSFRALQKQRRSRTKNKNENPSFGTTPLKKEEIKLINKLFLSRTSGLEPDLEIKELADIEKDYNERYLKRIIWPSKRWYEHDWKDRSTKILGMERFSKNLINGAKPNFNKRNEGITFHTQELLESPLKVGDIVLLKSNATELSMCVALPESADDPRYTFATIKGNLLFSTRSSINLRIPYSIPNGIANLITREIPHGFNPIGVIKSSINETFILPTVTRQHITSLKPFTVSHIAWEELPLTIKKLEVLHRFLQNPLGWYQIPFFQLVHLVDTIDMSSCNDRKYMKTLIDNSKNDSYNNLDASRCLSTYWAIIEQQETNMWGDIQRNSCSMSPISVTVNPLKAYQHFNDYLVCGTKQKDLDKIGQVTRLMNEKNYTIIKEKYPEFMSMLKDYASGNLNQNSQVAVLISAFLRKLNYYKDMDVSKTVCYKLLQEIDPTQFFDNILLFNHDLNLSNSSNLGQSNKQLYALCGPQISADADRVDFGNLRVYCIDSETAHEIDDGISIINKGNGIYSLSIHIADPSILFSGASEIQGPLNDDVFKLAMEKSFTTYLPDIVEPLLPNTYSEAADLGKNGQVTNAMTFTVNVKTLPDETLHVLYDTFDIKLSKIRNFPKVTYSRVNKILQSSDYSNPSVKQDLEDLHKIARALRNNRMKNGGAVVFGEGFNKGMIEFFEEGQAEVKNVKFIDQEETPATLLVSELMILTNTLCGWFFKKNNIPGIYRSYNKLLLGSKATMEYMSLQSSTKSGVSPSIKDMTRVSSLMNSSVYTSKPRMHEMIGAQQYLTVTSPLRRFPDLLNHFQIHRFLKKLPFVFNDEKLQNLIWHIQSRADILKKMSRAINTYWTLEYLQKAIFENPNKRFDVMITSVPNNGVVNCLFPDMSFARGKLKLKKGMPYPVIGDTVTNCRIVKLESLDGILYLEA